MEYGQQASSPYLRRDTVLITRMVNGMRELPHENWLRQLNVFFLERRRFREDLILGHNIFHGRLDSP